MTDLGTKVSTDITALIPAAGRAPEGVLALSNVTCPAMIPVAGRPVIQWTLSYLGSLGIRKVELAVSQRGLFVEEFVDCLFGDTFDISYVVPPRDGGPGLTVAELANRVTTPAALVVLGDTHFEFADPGLLDWDEPVVLIDDVEESYRWCVAELSSDGSVKGFLDKVPGMPPPLQALIGVYWFPDAGLLRECSANAVVEEGDRVELSAILRRVTDRGSLRAERAAKWLDCGNPDRQAASQRVLLQQRAFNELKVDETFGTITKRSHHVEKFIDEIAYLQLLPPELAVLFPRLIDCSTDAADPWVTMEFYGYPTLAELFVFENIDPGVWRRVFEHLFKIITEGFMHREQALAPSALEEMLLGRVYGRLAALDGPPALSALVNQIDTPSINGRVVQGMALLRPRLEEEVAKLVDSGSGTVIHGDLCFSNVLYDLRSGICKMIDPRGSFGDPGIYGDPRYDIAKLYHSVYGLYDFITADLFHVTIEGADVTLDIRTRPYHEEIRREFEDVFFPFFDHREILLFTGLIFVGIPGLHYDHPQRQLALFARGLELIHEALGLPDEDHRD